MKLKLSLTALISRIGVILGVVLLALAVYEALEYRAGLAKFLLMIGLIIGLGSAPLYYYVVAREKQPNNPLEGQVNILSAAGLSAKNKHQVAENGDGQRLKPIYPPDESKK